MSGTDTAIRFIESNVVIIYENKSMKNSFAAVNLMSLLMIYRKKIPILYEIIVVYLLVFNSRRLFKPGKLIEL